MCCKRINKFNISVYFLMKNQKYFCNEENHLGYQILKNILPSRKINPRYDSDSTRSGQKSALILANKRGLSDD